MDRLAHKYWSDVFKQSHDAKTEQTNHRNRTLKEDEMPQQGKSVIPVRIRRSVAHTNLQALGSPELQQQCISNQEQVQNSPRCVMAKRIYHEGESQQHQPLDQEKQDYPQQSKTKTYRKNHQSPGNQQRDRCTSPPPMPIQNIPQHQHQAGNPPQYQFKQQPLQQYRETANQNSTKQLSHGNPEMNKTPCDKQTHKNTPKIIEQCQQAEHQNPPKKILSENQFKQQPPQEYQEIANQKSTKKYRHRIPHNMQQVDDDPKITPHMKLHHLKTEFQDLPMKDQYFDPPQAPPHDQLKQQPQQEYHQSPGNHKKDRSPSRPPMPIQNVPQHQAGNPTHDQFKQQPLQEYREIANQNSSYKLSHGNLELNKPPIDKQPRTNTVNIIEQCQNPPEKVLSENQFKQQPPQEYRETAYQKSTKKYRHKIPHNMQQPDDDPQITPHMKLHHLKTEFQDLPMKDQYVDPTEAPPHDQLKQQPPKEYRKSHQQLQQQPQGNQESSYQNCTKKTSLDNPLNMQQPHDDHKITPHMKLHHLKTEFQDIPMKDQYVCPPQAPPHDQLKQQQHLENQETSYQKSQKNTMLKNFLNMQHNPYIGHLQVPPHDQLKQDQLLENQETAYQKSTKKPSLENPQSMQQPTQQRHENYPQESKMSRKDNAANQKYVTKQERYPSPPPMPYQNVPQHQPEQHYPHHHSRKHQSNINTQQRQHFLQQHLLLCDIHKNTAMLQNDIGDFVYVIPTEYQNSPRKDPYEDPPQAQPHDQLKQQPSQEYRGESFCHSSKQMSHSNQSQKQPFSNAPQEQAQLNLSESNSMAKVLPVPRPESNRRRVSQNSCGNAYSPQPSFIGYKSKEEKSPEGCKKDSPKKVSKSKQSTNENQLSGATAFEISSKSGDELRSMVREEIELQLLLIELSKITKKGEILDATLQTSLESKETSSTSSGSSSEESQPDDDNTVDNIVNGKVITPMIRKIQDMYIRNLRCELDLVEYLKQVPDHVTEVCRDSCCKDQNKL